MTAKTKDTPMRLALGPVLYNWAPEVWRDFYFRIADEAPVDSVYVGEVVCSKRAPFFEPVLPAVVERLAAAGKEVVHSTLALVMSKREVQAVRDLAADADALVEANDMTAVAHLTGRPHVIGPQVNVYNEGTLGLLARSGATRVCLPGELPAASLARLTAFARGLGVETEVHAFGRLPLAISARCYTARARGLTKDGCLFVCGEDPDGMALETLDAQPFLTVNGVQTQSRSHVNLIRESGALAEMGVGRLRLSPQSCDMVAVAGIFRDVLDGRREAEAGFAALQALAPDAVFSNGFFHATEGAALVAANHRAG